MKAGSSNILTMTIIRSAPESSIRTQIQHLKEISLFFFFPEFSFGIILIIIIIIIIIISFFLGR